MSVEDSASRRFELYILVELFSGRPWPNIWPGIIFSVLFRKFGTFLVKLCGGSDRYRNIMAGGFEIHFIFGNNSFPLASDICADFCTVPNAIYCTMHK